MKEFFIFRMPLDAHCKTCAFCYINFMPVIFVVDAVIKVNKKNEAIKGPDSKSNLELTDERTDVFNCPFKLRRYAFKIRLVA